jgi:cell division transport system permease protein
MDTRVKPEYDKYMLTSSDIYFRADDSQRFLPWLIGIMAMLAALLLCLGITLSGWIISTGGQYSKSFTVNIPVYDRNGEQLVDQVKAVVEKNPSVTSVNRIADSELLKILEPWLGTGESAHNIPLPVVLDVSVRSGKDVAKIDFQALEHELTAIDAGIEIDAHERWVAAFSDFSAVAQTLLVILAGVLLAAMGITIAFTSRASLKLHGRTVQLLHSIGAEDNYVTRQFQREAGRLVLIGAATGTILAGLLYYGVGRYL